MFSLFLKYRISRMDIWDRFRTEAKSQSQFQVDFVVTGDSRAGKTAVISRFLDQSPPSKPTVALEYLYARKGDTICNIIESEFLLLVD